MRWMILAGLTAWMVGSGAETLMKEGDCLGEVEVTQAAEEQAKRDDRLREFLSESLGNVHLRRRQTKLHLAAREGFTEAVKAELQRGADPNAQDYRGDTPLHMAAGDGHTQAIQELLCDKRTNPNLRDTKHESTPLHDAAGRNHAQAVRVLVADSRTDPNLRDYEDRTPLHEAAQDGHTEAVEALLESEHVEHDPTRGEWGTPLMYAAEEGHAETVLALVEGGADPHLQVRDMTAMHLAAEEGRAAVLTALLLKGADPNIRNVPHDETPLYYAVRGQEPQAVLALLVGGADPHLQTKWGETPLHDAAMRGGRFSACPDNEGVMSDEETERALAIVRMLLVAAAGRKQERGSGRMPLVMLQDKNGQTALHEAVDTGNLEAVYAIVDDIVRRTGNLNEAKVLLNVLDAENRTATALARDLAGFSGRFGKVMRPIDRIPEYQRISMLIIDPETGKLKDSYHEYIDPQTNTVVELKDPYHKRGDMYVSRKEYEDAKKKWCRPKYTPSPQIYNLLHGAGGEDWAEMKKAIFDGERRKDKLGRIAVQMARANLKKTRDAIIFAEEDRLDKKKVRKESARKLRQCRAGCRETYKTKGSDFPGASMCEAGNSFIREVTSRGYSMKSRFATDRATYLCDVEYLNCSTGCARKFR